MVKSLNELESIDEAKNIVKRLSKLSYRQQAYQIIQKLFLATKYIKDVEKLRRIQDSRMIGGDARLIVSNRALNPLQRNSGALAIPNDRELVTSFS
jgi:hypothetical protein